MCIAYKTKCIHLTTNWWVIPCRKSWNYVSSTSWQDDSYNIWSLLCGIPRYLLVKKSNLSDAVSTAWMSSAVIDSGHLQQTTIINISLLSPHMHIAMFSPDISVNQYYLLLSRVTFDSTHNSHFGDESFHAIDCTHTDDKTQNDREKKTKRTLQQTCPS